MRKYVMEAVGSFFLALAIAGGNPVAIGLILMTIMYLGANVSGANYNPGISVAMYLRGRLARKELTRYIIAQLVGAAVAIAAFRVLTNNPYNLDAITDGAAVSFLMEAVLFALFAQLFLVMMASDQYKNNAIFGAVIGLALVGIDMLGGYFNPALAFDSILMSLFRTGGMKWEPLLVYVAGPLVGGVLGAYSYDYFYGNKRGAK